MASRSLSSLLLLSLLVFLLLSPYLSSPAAGQGKKKKLTEKELQDLEDQWFEDEEEDASDPTRWKKGPDGERVPPKRPAKSEMAFVALKRPITKDDTSKWASETSDLLISGGVEVKGYAVEAGKVLFVCDKGSADMVKVKRMVLGDTGGKVVDFEWNQKKYYPQASEDSDPMDNVDVEALLARARSQQAEQETAKAAGGGESKMKAKKAKKSADSAYLGGAGAPIPADFPDEL